jgi:F-type H+-transporting ATPase subunit gamma
MASLREIRQKIKSYKSTQQITKAMKMVAAARLRKAQQAMLNSRPFAQKMEELMVESASYIDEMDELPFVVKPIGTKRLLLVVTSDKGLAGAFNTNLIREAQKYIRQYGAANVDLVIVGRKGRDFFRRTSVPMLKEYVNILGQVRFAQAEVITTDLLDIYHTKKYAVVDVLFNEFKSVMQQKVTLKTLLPVIHPERKKKLRWPDYIYDPDRIHVIRALWLRRLKAQIFHILLESAAGELGARMSAMENATQNASELLSSLTLLMNRTRQAVITNDILEVVSGAEALK